MDNLDILMKQYETLRQESLAAIQNRTSVLTFGQATLAAIFTLAMSSGDKRFASFTLIVIFPIVAGLLASIWLGEYERMHRAGRFIAHLELRIARAKKAQLLTWERLIRRQRQHMVLPYNHTLLFFALVGTAGIILGLITITVPIKLDGLISVSVFEFRVIVGTIGLSLNALYYYRLLRRMRSARDGFNSRWEKRRTQLPMTRLRTGGAAGERDLLLIGNELLGKRAAGDPRSSRAKARY